MKKYLVLISLLIGNSVAFASSDVIFPIKNQVVKPYPDQASINLNGTKGMPLHNEVSYKLTCHINNPNKDVVIIQYSVYPFLGCSSRGDCGGQKLNSKGTGSMLHLDPGVNTFEAFGFMTVSDSPNTKLYFKNYDNTLSVVVQDCTAVLE